VFGITFYGDTLDLGRVRVHDCPRCGPSNHRLRMRYRSLVLLHITGVPLQRRWLLRCEVCYGEQPTTPALAQRYVASNPIPWLHRNLLFPLKLLAMLALLLALGLGLLIALSPSFEQRVENVQPGQQVLVELSALSGTGEPRYAWLEVSAVEGEQIVLAPAARSYATERLARRSRWDAEVPSQPEPQSASKSLSRDALVEAWEQRWVHGLSD
jgi:hypothetical protein